MDLDKAIRKYIDAILEEYEIEEEFLLNLWKKTQSTIKPKTPPTKTSLSRGELMAMKKTGIMELCKVNGISTTGTKQVLIDKLLNSGGSTQTINTNISHKKSKKMNIIQKIQEETPTINVRENSFGNFEHHETRLVFDKHTAKVIGKQAENGKILPLSTEDVDHCKEYLFVFP